MGYKIGVSGTTIATAIFLWMVTFFETVESAEDWRNAHTQALICKTVADMRGDIRALEIQVRFAKTPEDKAFFKEQIREIKAEIRRIDPKGVC